MHTVILKQKSKRQLYIISMKIYSCGGVRGIMSSFRLKECNIIYFKQHNFGELF